MEDEEDVEAFKDYVPEESAPAAPASAPTQAAEPAPAQPAAAAAPTPAAAPAAASSTGRVFASPLAKKLASEGGIDLGDVTPSGPGGRVIKRDIDSYQPSRAAPMSFAPSVEGEVEDIPITQIRKVIADRRSFSK